MQEVTPELVDKFLDIVSKIESDDKYYAKHPTIKNPKSIHYGDAAIGKYAIMPNTAWEIITKQKSQLSPRLVDALKRYDNLKTMLEENPELQRDLAYPLAEKVLRNMRGDIRKAVYAWEKGTNLTYDKVSEDDFLKDSSGRMRKVDKLLGSEMSPTKTVEQIKLTRRYDMPALTQVAESPTLLVKSPLGTRDPNVLMEDYGDYYSKLKNLLDQYKKITSPKSTQAPKNIPEKKKESTDQSNIIRNYSTTSTTSNDENDDKEEFLEEGEFFNKSQKQLMDEINDYVNTVENLHLLKNED